MKNIFDYLKKLNKENIKRKIRKSMVFQVLPFFSILLTLSNGRPVISASQFVNDAHNGYSSEDAIVSIMRKPAGSDSTDTQNVWFGMWSSYAGNYNPPLSQGDTLLVNIQKEGYKTNARWVIPTDESCCLPHVHLDDPNKSVEAFTPNIETIIDTSYVNAPFKGILWLEKNPNQPCTTQVDTAFGPERAYDFFDNLEKQDSIFTHGDSAFIKLLKERNDTTFYTFVPFEIDTSLGRLMVVKSNGNSGSDTLYFPLDISVFKDIGIEQILVPDTADSGQVITPGVVINNHGTINQDPYLHCKINEFYHDSTQVIAQPGIDTFYFSPCTLNQVGDWIVTDYSVLQGDVNPGNDTLQKTITVNPVGIKENKQKNIESKFVKQSHGTQFDIRGSWELYDLIGNKVAEYQNGNDQFKNHNFGMYPQGVYFLKKEKEDGKDLIEKIIILR